ncbi:MAG TPA: thioesterase family protein [Candidatus Competibacter sp.]|nr:acyl-CoA thioesterase [Candidatus Competibacteraceae bacterium]HUM92932.1 thioesterase family protein [Candidatus Competibacter sp.]
MARIKLELPADFPYSIDLPVRITDINYAGHMGNPVVLALLHEARFQFMAHHGLQELKVEGLGLIITDSAIIYKSEAFAGETLTVAVAVGDFNKYGCDFFYRVTEKNSGREVAHAKTGIVFFDYQQRTVRNIPHSFLKLFPDAAPV